MEFAGCNVVVDRIPFGERVHISGTGR